MLSCFPAWGVLICQHSPVTLCQPFESNPERTMSNKLPLPNYPYKLCAELRPVFGENLELLTDSGIEWLIKSLCHSLQIAWEHPTTGQLKAEPLFHLDSTFDRALHYKDTKELRMDEALSQNFPNPWEYLSLAALLAARIAKTSKFPDELLSWPCSIGGDNFLLLSDVLPFLRILVDTPKCSFWEIDKAETALLGRDIRNKSERFVVIGWLCREILAGYWSAWSPPLETLKELAERKSKSHGGSSGVAEFLAQFCPLLWEMWEELGLLSCLGNFGIQELTEWRPFHLEGSCQQWAETAKLLGDAELATYSILNSLKPYFDEHRLFEEENSMAQNKSKKTRLFRPIYAPGLVSKS